MATPSLSSWGDKGYGDVWCNGSNDWIYRHLHEMAERMVELAHTIPTPTALERRALDQAARELLLAQSSDWAFIMKTGTTVPYATKRTTEHVKRFTRIYEALIGRTTIDEAWLEEVVRRDNLFPEMDYRLYGT